MSKYSSENKKPLNHPESIVLNHVVLMAQQSLDPDGYDMFCTAHDRIVENRHLQNKELITDKHQKINPYLPYWYGKRLEKVFPSLRVVQQNSGVDLTLVKKLKHEASSHLQDIENIKNDIKELGYIEPVECLGCGWTGLENELDQNCKYIRDNGESSNDNTGCPVCKSLSWEFTDIV